MDASDSLSREGMIMTMNRLRLVALVSWATLALGGLSANAQERKSYPSFGSIERKDPRLDRIIPKDATLEKLAEGFDWSEGPVWDRRGGYLLFSDVPQNTVFRWKEGEGVKVFFKPSGYTGTTPRGGEPGSNGLVMNSSGQLVLCQHGDRRVALYEGEGRPFGTIADRYEGKRFNSPNDAVFKSNGDLYFTDPPYGLLGQNNDPAKELKFNGVYRVSKTGVTLLTTELSFPNGIALSPDEKTLYVANSDSNRAIWMAFDVKDDGTLGKGRVFADVTSLTKTKKGLPDGMKVDRAGNLFATGPGGVLIFDADGTHLGTIETGEATANCGWGEDGSTLYITADMYLARIKLTTTGTGFFPRGVDR